jgi:2-oxoglutarate ferredoxin oxidoreductase subunit alpha
LPAPDVFGAPDGEVLLVGWGSTQGPIREAVTRARREGQAYLGDAHHLHQSSCPTIWKIFPASATFSCRDERWRPLRLRPVGGDPAGAVLRPRIEGINKTDGLTWKVREILDAVQASASASTALARIGH